MSLRLLSATVLGGVGAGEVKAPAAAAFWRSGLLHRGLMERRPLPRDRACVSAQTHTSTRCCALTTSCWSAPDL